MNIEKVIKHFNIYGDLVKYKGYGNGHINNTYVSTFNQGGVEVKYTHQRINKNVFKSPSRVMENIVLVTNHLRKEIDKENLPLASSRVLTVVNAKDGNPYYIDDHGDYWRTYIFIDKVYTYEKMESKELSYALGAKIGEFQRQLSNYDGPKLYDTIPKFHDMEDRYRQLEEAIEKNKANRLDSVKSEVDFLLENKERGCRITRLLKEGKLKLGITHNDTKLNNVLFDKETNKAMAVIDLDTVMPGTILFDTGDMIRTAVITSEEDEKDLSKVECNIEYFTSLVKGYMSIMNDYLTDLEKSLICESGRTITLIMAVRFLTDYLNGDKYYIIAYPEHNIDRMHTQMKLIQSMDRQQGLIDKIISF